MHLLVLPERHVDTFRDIAVFRPTRRSAMLEFVAETAREGRLEDYRVVVNVGAERRPDRLPPALARPRRARSRRRRMTLIARIEEELTDAMRRATPSAATRCA